MKERIFEKQNNGSIEYQLRAKQYSQLNCQNEMIPLRKKEARREFNYYPSSAFENKVNKLQEISSYQRPPQRQTAYDDKYGKGNKYEGVGNYVKDNYARDRYEPTVIPNEDKKPRYNHYQFNNQQDQYADHSFGESSLQTDTSNLYPNKRQHPKRKGLEIKMNNIENINDKINSLLSMVKKDKIDRSSKERAFSISPKQKQSPPIINRGNVLANFQDFEQIEPIRTTEKINPYKDGSKSQKRLKTYSAFQSNKNEQNEIDRVKQFNQEDKISSKPKYSPSNYHHSSPRNKSISRPSYNERHQNPPQKAQYQQLQQYKYSPVKQKDIKVFAAPLENTSGIKRAEKKYDEEPTYKYEKIDLQYKNFPQQNGKIYDRREKTPSKQNAQNFIPMTLVQNDIRIQRSNMERNQQNNQGMKMIDNQIRKIKDKINQSENKHKKYQERLIDNREQRTPHNAGKIYSKDGTSSTKKFQIKVYPVVNNKPQTVKIAEKLCYQIEVDNRMRKARQSFQEIEGEQKWRDLEIKLNKNGIKLTFIEIKQLLLISPDEFSPFDSVQKAQQNILKPFSDSQKFWENQVCGCASQKALKSEGFNINELDLNKKGYLCIQDLVCFVNLYTGHFYKNRDLAIIFRRLQLLDKCKKTTAIDFPTFFRVFTI